MRLTWTDEQTRAYEETLADVRDRLGDEPGRHGPRAPFTRKRWRLCGELGLLGLPIPVEYGGRGLGALDSAHLVEAFGRGCPDAGLVFGASAHLFACAVPIAEFGRPELKSRILPALCSGDAVAGNAITEEDAGSDVSKLATTARRDGDGYVLDGEKTFVTNGPEADVFVVYATTDPTAGFLGAAGFVVERDAPGVEVSEPFGKMGLNGCPAGVLRLVGCRVPDANVLGVPGQGGAIFQHSMTWERSCLFAGWVGAMERTLERCVEHARTRRQFGRRIGGFQAVSHRIADMKLRLEAARWLLYRACWLVDHGEDATVAVALSKLAVSEAAVQSGLDAISIFGGRGYLVDHGIEEVLRDAVPTTIFSGTSDIQREMVARGVGL